ncbi:hypothetical protein [uncultured Mediterranean phage uvMED]|nr:hypothetical protein [uncultured Mediterranean phage uvMED]
MENQLLVESEKGGCIITDHKKNNLIFSSVKEAENYVKEWFPIWNEGLEKEESKDTFYVYDSKNPKVDLKVFQLTN